MKALCFSGISTNPEIIDIALQIFEVIKLSAARAVEAANASPGVGVPNAGLEATLHSFLVTKRSRNPVEFKALSRRLAPQGLMGVGSRSAAVVNSTALRPAASLKPDFAVDFASGQSVFTQALRANAFKDVSLKRTLENFSYDPGTKRLVVPQGDVFDSLTATLAWRTKLLEQKFTAPSATDLPPAAKKLRLKLSKLQAIKRYGWEITDWGDDTINCGGAALDVVAASQIKVNQFRVGTFKRDGQVVDIKPDATFAEFTLPSAGKDWPRAYTATSLLAEKDADGGFIDVLRALWDAIAKEVIELATTAATSLVGGVIGAAVLSEFPVIGTIVGAIVGAAIGYAVGFLLDTLKDDIFESTDQPGIVLDSPNFRFEGGSLKSPKFTQEFRHEHARYLMTYYWELSTWRTAAENFGDRDLTRKGSREPSRRNVPSAACRHSRLAHA